MRLGFVVWVALGLSILSACSGTSEPKAPGTPACAAPSLAADATVSYAGGGGFAGRTSGFVAFGDGRVQLDEDGKTRSVDVGRERVAKLGSDLRATGVTDEDDGCYVPDEPVADGTGAELTFRDGASLRKWGSSDGARAPDAVTKALGVAQTFLDEASKR